MITPMCLYCGEDKAVEVLRSHAGNLIVICQVCAQSSVIPADRRCGMCGGVNAHREGCAGDRTDTEGA